MQLVGLKCISGRYYYSLLILGFCFVQVNVSLSDAREKTVVVPFEQATFFGEEQDNNESIDPYESINRAIFDFNLRLDKYFLKPVAIGYRAILPNFAQRGVNNVFFSLSEVPTTANSLLQGKLLNAAKSTLRLTINLTLGFFGVFDVATQLGVVANNEDFGQTLHVWGLSSQGPYLVVPFLGSFTVRSGAGFLVDTFAFDPLLVKNVATRNSLFTLRLVDKRAELLDAEELIIGDPYIFVRSLYLQQRDYGVKEGSMNDSFDNSMDSDDGWLDD